MTPYAVSLDLFDPTGPDRMTGDDRYGGETRLFVLAATTLDDALRRLCEAVSKQDARIDRVHKAVPANAFEENDFPFDLDLAAMIKDALEQGEICVTPDYTFSPYDLDPLGAFYGLFEFFDLGFDTGGGPYAGEFTYAASKANTCGDALIAVLNDLKDATCVLKSVEDFSDAAFYDRSVPLSSGTLGDVASGSEIGSVIWAQGSSIYGSDDDA